MFTKKQIAMANKCKSSNELLAMAKAEGLGIDMVEADKYFAQLSKNNGLNELSLDDLEAVTGGININDVVPTVTGGSGAACD